MKSVFWVIKLVLFFLALTFALKNTDSVTIRYYLGAEWQAPLIFVILVVFCLGAIAGVIASLGQVIRLRREVSRLRKQVPPPTTSGELAVSPRTVPPGFPDVV
jgi:putative membrane protein